MLRKYEENALLSWENTTQRTQLHSRDTNECRAICKISHILELMEMPSVLLRIILHANDLKYDSV